MQKHNDNDHIEDKKNNNSNKTEIKININNKKKKQDTNSNNISNLKDNNKKITLKKTLAIHNLARQNLRFFTVYL